MKDPRPRPAIQTPAESPASCEETPSALAPHVPQSEAEHDEDERDELSRLAHALARWLNRPTRQRDVAAKVDALSEKLDAVLNYLSRDKRSGQLLSVKAAAQHLSLSERTIRERLAVREWPAYRCGKALRVDPEEIRARMRAKA